MTAVGDGADRFVTAGGGTDLTTGSPDDWTISPSSSAAGDVSSWRVGSGNAAQ